MEALVIFQGAQMTLVTSVEILHAFHLAYERESNPPSPEKRIPYSKIT